MTQLVSDIFNETTNYFQTLKSHSESMINNIDKLKRYIIEKRTFRFKDFINYLNSYYKNTIQKIQSLEPKLEHIVVNIDSILSDSCKAEKNIIEQQELTILLKNSGVTATVASITIIAVGLTPVGAAIGIGAGIAGYFGSDNLFSKNNYDRIKNITDQFLKFSNLTTDLQQNLNDEKQSLLLSESKLESLNLASKVILKDYSVKDEEKTMGSVVLEEDVNMDFVLRSLDLMKKKTQEIFNVTTKITNDFFNFRHNSNDEQKTLN